jgi:putative acetyltransferase
VIRKFEIDDLTDVMRIWLESNNQAHDFIDESYWRGNFETVKDLLPKSTYMFMKTMVRFKGLLA